MISNNLGVYSSNAGTFSILFNEEKGIVKEKWISSKKILKFKILTKFRPQMQPIIEIP
jgi:hypothetical protein